MGKRRTARERALQALYELEFNAIGPEAALSASGPAGAAPEEAAAYAAWLVRGVLARQEEIDALIQSTSHNWRVARMTPIDRNLLRLAALEMLEEAATLPAAVVINEAIEIARRFSGEESAVFVNGVLDAVRKRLAAGTPTGKVDEHEPRPETERPAAGSPPARRGGGGAKKRPGAGPGRKA
jgi:N utilization substance protein B